MKNIPIGFKAEEENTAEINCLSILPEDEVVKPSVVEVHFPECGKTYSYFNDRFDIKPGDFVFVEGCFAEMKGQVISVNYSFKIKLSEYKRIVSVVNTAVTGDFYIAGNHLVTFDRYTLPVSKVKTWFTAPDEEEYITGDDCTNKFPLNDLSRMAISQEIAMRGHNYYLENRVIYICIDGNKGYALVKGSEFYEVEFYYIDGEICDLKCSCFCAFTCKHEFAVMLQLKELLDCIEENYFNHLNGYFAAMSQVEFLLNTKNSKKTGKIKVEF